MYFTFTKITQRIGELLMQRKKGFIRLVSQFVLVSFLMVNLQHAAFAGMVTTADIIDNETVQLEKQRIYQLLARDDVRTQLIEMGVNPEDAVKRVDSMTSQEVQIFSQNMQELPAGGDVLGVILIVFLVLLFTDIMGYTDIFPFVKKTAR